MSSADITTPALCVIHRMNLSVQLHVVNSLVFSGHSSGGHRQFVDTCNPQVLICNYILDSGHLSSPDTSFSKLLLSADYSGRQVLFFSVILKQYCIFSFADIESLGSSNMFKSDETKRPHRQCEIYCYQC